ncbi:hypothetical protein [Kribbella sp. NPDC048928]|uniref:hypothetical protein n=1 Tax=Kribbella sp. NPDC048928 TaxID=3364111 RepID=UPI003713B80F
MDYETLDAEIRALSDRMEDADEATIAAEVERLKRLAAQIPDELGRARGLARAERLPELIVGPAPGTSEQYLRATHLLGIAMGSDGTPAERIDLAERTATEIALLAEAAPYRESNTILRMNSALARLIHELSAIPES